MFRHALAPLAEAMGDAARAAEARQRGDELLRAAIARFWSTEQRVFLDNLPWLAEDEAPRMSDRALATAILFDQCPGGDTAAALRALAEVPQNMGLSYPCNAGWRYWALAELGRADVVLHDFRTRWATMRSVIENNTLQEDVECRSPTPLRSGATARWRRCSCCTRTSSACVRSRPASRSCNCARNSATCPTWKPSATRRAARS